MPHIEIISASVRIGRNSHRVARYFKNYIEENKLATVSILDLNEYQFPIFEERLRFLSKPEENVLEFANRITDADGVIIVTPEYNGGYPASLKNVVDLLYKEWKRKPIAISTASDGQFGGTQAITQIEFVLWKIGALVIPARCPVATVQDHYDEAGNPTDKEKTDKHAGTFLAELFWMIKAVEKSKKQS
ncbi:MAG: NADPH-dependent FMN reductase [Bacteroidia bacterium]